MESSIFAENSPLASLQGEESNDTFSQNSNFYQIGLFGNSKLHTNNFTGIEGHTSELRSTENESLITNNYEDIYILKFDHVLQDKTNKWDINENYYRDNKEIITDRTLQNFLQNYIINKDFPNKEEIKRIISDTIKKQIPKPNIWLQQN